MISIHYNEDTFKFIPSKTNYEAVNQLQAQWFEDFKQSKKDEYQLEVIKYAFVFQVKSAIVGLEWIQLDVEKQTTHIKTSATTRLTSQHLIHVHHGIPYHYESLKESEMSLVLAQALHQFLHTQPSNLVVNVKKLQRFIMDEQTQLTISSEGLKIQSQQCHEAWCPSSQIEAVIDLRFVHDQSLVVPSLWLHPIDVGVFKSDPMIDKTLPMKALTFDDGPKTISMNLVNILEKSHTKATFFWIGLEVAAHPVLAKTIFDLGHEIGNHTYHHKRLIELSLEEVSKEVQTTDEIIERITGTRPTIMRPPYGQLNREQLVAFNHKVILWNVDTVDWLHRDASIILKSLNKTRDGDIILMHDVFEWTHVAVEPFIQQQLSLGVQFVTVTQLIEAKKLDTRIIHGVRPPTSVID